MATTDVDTKTVVISGDSGELELDVAISVSHVWSVDSTEHPVEKGVAITDHLRTKPSRVTIEGFVSDIPPKGEPGHVEAAKYFIQNLRDNPELVTITTLLEDYDDMGFISASPMEKADLGGAIQFTSEWKAIRVVETDVSLGKVKKAGAKPKGKSDPKPDPNAKKPSLLQDIKKNGFGGAVRNAKGQLGA